MNGEKNLLERPLQFPIAFSKSIIARDDSIESMILQKHKDLLISKLPNKIASNGIINYIGEIQTFRRERKKVTALYGENTKKIASYEYYSKMLLLSSTCMLSVACMQGQGGMISAVLGCVASFGWVYTYTAAKDLQCSVINLGAAIKKTNHIEENALDEFMPLYLNKICYAAVKTIYHESQNPNSHFSTLPKDILHAITGVFINTILTIPEAEAEKFFMSFGEKLIAAENTNSHRSYQRELEMELLLDIKRITGMIAD